MLREERGYKNDEISDERCIEIFLEAGGIGEGEKKDMKLGVRGRGGGRRR